MSDEEKRENEESEDTNEYGVTLPGLRFDKNRDPMFIAGSMSWPNCPYAAGVAAQYHQWKMLGHFVNGGIALAVQKGQADILRLLGVPVPGDVESLPTGVEAEDALHLVGCTGKGSVPEARNSAE